MGIKNICSKIQKERVREKTYTKRIYTLHSVKTDEMAKIMKDNKYIQ